jgi:uncharacterized protein
MHLEGREEVAVPRQRAWDYLIDPRNVAACVPGNPAIEKVDGTHYRIRFAIGGGFLRTNATVNLAVTQAEEPLRATIEGSGGAMGGSVNAATHVELVEVSPDRTAIAWSADVTLGGSISGLSGMMEAPVRKQLDRTLDCVRQRLESGA